MSQDGGRGSGFYLQYSQGDNRWAFSMLAGDTDNATPHRALSTAAPATGAWTHLAGVHDAENGQLRLYVNGALQSSVPHTGAWNAAG
ncbi:LamG-like jellyroll fold domain-containing protein, partial [Escherichia coli]